MLFLGGVASADRWDSRGWVKLGERGVDGGRGRVDTDTIVVGRYEGKFSKLTLVVEKSDLQLEGFTVKFGNGSTWSPPGLRHVFRENQRTRIIDLPGDDRVIQSITLSYRNLPGGGKAAVEVWGLKSEPPKPVMRRHAWNNSGWQKLGEQKVNGRVDRDVYPVGAYKGKFEKLQIIVQDDDLELLDMEVRFARGPAWKVPGIRHYFKEGARSRVIDLPGRDERVIKSIEMLYKNVPGGGAATVEIWGR
ncbi:MAG: hypothetical protein KIT31_22230 [Deltaproteobacteria bacterium]|nr:hypothetical protein [Deltaproteobacteria bacterium]